VVPGAAPKAGTELTRERMAENLQSLNTPWSKPSEIDADLPLDEMRQLARTVWDEGTYGEPASTLASYVLALLGEPPFPLVEKVRRRTQGLCPHCKKPIGATDLARDARYGGKLRTLHADCYAELWAMQPAPPPEQQCWIGGTDAEDDERSWK
jgi:hypothetical protein